MYAAKDKSRLVSKGQTGFTYVVNDRQCLLEAAHFIFSLPARK